MNKVLDMRKFKWTDLALLPFGLCVLFLLALGKLCGLTYKQISVVFNLWIQGAILMLSGLILWPVAIYRFIDSGDLSWLCVSIVYLPPACLYVYGYIRMLRHYHLPFNDAFDRCVSDLQRLAGKWHTTYQVVNLLIFVVFFLLLLSLNIVSGYLLLKMKCI